MAYIGKSPSIGNFQVCDSISVVNGQAAYTMQVSSVNVVPESNNHVLCSLNGILQRPGSSFTVSGSTITFASNLVTGDVIDFIMLLGNVLDIGTPSDSTVTDAKANFVSTSSAAGLQIKGDGTTAGALQLNCEQNSHGIKLQSPPHSANQSYTLKFPSGNVTAGKVLKVDSVSGSGTTGIGTLTFGDASSDFVLLSSVDVSSATAEVEFDGFFSSTYKNYKLIASGILPATNSARLRMLGKESGSYVTGGYSYTVGGDFVYNSTDGGESDEKASAQSYGLITSEMSNTTSEVNGFDMTIYDPLGSHYKAFNWHSHNWGSVLTNLHRNFIGSLMIRNSTADLTAIKFYFDSGNIAKGNFKLYGIK